MAFVELAGGPGYHGRGPGSAAPSLQPRARTRDTHLPAEGERLGLASGSSPRLSGIAFARSAALAARSSGHRRDQSFSCAGLRSA